jgi:hypothetical protein
VRLAVLPLAAICAAALAGCAGTLQDQPIPHNLLESLIVAPTPVYWLGGSFQGLAVTEASHDPSGAYSVQYGDCLRGGQATCVPSLRVVSSPDNSFLPGAPSSGRVSSPVRGVPAVLAHGGSTIVLPTGGVVVDVYAKDARLAAAAARALVPINSVGAPEAPLPAPRPDTGFGETPLPSQIPSRLRPLG